MQKLLRLCLPLCALALLAASPSHAATPPAKKVLIVGRITDKPEKQYPATKAMAEYLAQQMKDLGYEDGQVLLTPDTEQMIKQMKAGHVHLLNDTVFKAARLIDEADAEPLLKAYRKRAGYHRVAFFARKDSGIQSLADLRGRIIAFEDAASTTGYMIPAAILLGERLELAALQSPRQAVPNGKIGYVFSGEEINSALMVHKGVVQASVFGNTDLETEGSMPAEIRDDMNVFYQSPQFPRSLMVVSKHAPATVKERLKKILIAAPADPDAAKLLVGYHAITKFDAVNATDLQGLDEGRRIDKTARTRLKMN